MEDIGHTISIREKVVEEKELQAASFRLDVLHVNFQAREVSVEYHLGDTSGQLIGSTRHVTLNPLIDQDGETSDNWDSIVQGDKVNLDIVKTLFRQVIK